MKSCVYTVKVGLFNKVWIWSGFYETSPGKGQMRSGLVLDFLKFLSGFSLDFTFLSPEYKLGALPVVSSDHEIISFETFLSRMSFSPGRIG